MNFAMTSAPFFLILLWIAVWVAGFYLIVRAVRAFERVADAHERIAIALAKPRGPGEPPLHERPM